jgi:hypothetical protein
MKNDTEEVRDLLQPNRIEKTKNNAVSTNISLFERNPKNRRPIATNMAGVVIFITLKSTWLFLFRRKLKNTLDLFLSYKVNITLRPYNILTEGIVTHEYITTFEG